MARCYAFGCQATATFLVQSEQEAGFEGIPACQYHGDLLVRGRVHPAYLVFVGDDLPVVPVADVLAVMASAPPVVAEVVAMMAESGEPLDWVAGTRWGELNDGGDDDG
jgi:hypothetical protein